VSDNGPGLSDDTIVHMFEPYYQLSKKRSSKQGLGVGLSIVKKIVDDLGATIDYIKKPFSIKELEKKIKSIISLRNRMEKHQIINIRKGLRF
jgi:signal transduction histidine kinase